MVQFASRMDLLKGSEIRELLKLTAQTLLCRRYARARAVPR